MVEIFLLPGRHTYMLDLVIGITTMAASFGARSPMTDNLGTLGVYISTTLVSTDQYRLSYPSIADRPGTYSWRYCPAVPS